MKDYIKKQEELIEMLIEGYGERFKDNAVYKKLYSELSVLKSKMEEVAEVIYDIDCDGNVMIQLSIKDGIPAILQAMNGGGEPLKVSSIIISKAHRDNQQRKENDMEQIPRRNRLDLNTPAELAIYNAMQEVENVGADERLTEAVVLLQKAKDCVANFVDDVNGNYDKTNDVHYWKCPECNSIFATSKKTPEWMARKMKIVHINKYYDIPCRAEYVEITKEEFFEIDKKLK